MGVTDVANTLLLDGGGVIFARRSVSADFAGTMQSSFVRPIQT